MQLNSGPHGNLFLEFYLRRFKTEIVFVGQGRAHTNFFKLLVTLSRSKSHRAEIIKFYLKVLVAI